MRARKFQELNLSEARKTKMNNKTAFLAVFGILALLLAPNVLALGISPGRTTVDFTPGLERTVSFSIVNSENKDMNIVVAAQGELKDYITINDKSFSMSSEEGSRQVTYTIRLPKELSPGLHTAEIVVLQLPEEGKLSEAYIGAALAVVTQLHVNVPYPGKYAEASLNVIGPESDGKISFVMPVLSRGEFDLVNVRATIDIYTSLNKKVATLNTNEVSIPSRKRKEIVAVWDSSKAPPGPYRAVATLLYDEKSLTLEKDFEVGEKRLKIEKIEVNDFSLGDIAKFEMLVENTWSEAVRGVYSEMNIYNKDKKLMAEFKSPTYDIDPLSKTLMVSFWDTAGVKEGTYDSTVYLRYGGKSEKEDLKIEVRENEINVIGLGYAISERRAPRGENNGLVTILVIAIVILVMINLLWFLFLRRKIKSR